MSSALRISRGVIAALITLCVFFTCLPAGRTVKAATNPTVYYACKENVDDENVIVNTGSIPEGQHCFAVLVDNGGSQFPYTVEQFIKDSYSDTDEDNNIPVIVNNALIDAGDLSDLNFVLLGNGKAQFNGYGFFSNANNAYTGDKTDFDALESYIGGLGDLQSSYSLNVFGNMTIKEPAVFNAVYISNNCTLTVSHEGNNGHTELTVDTLNIAGSGKVVIADGAEPNGLNIMKELNAPDGSITGANGSVLQIESGAVVKGGITLYAQGGTTALTGAGFSNITYLETESYTYWTVGYDSARWIEDGEPGPEDPPGIYVAFNNEFFTSCTYKIDNGESQGVPLDGHVLTGGNAGSITFTFVPEAGTLNVKQGDQNLTVTNNSFTINKTDFDWTQRPCYVEVTTARPNGIYFHYEDGLVDEINYELGESSSYTVSGNYIAPSVYEHVSGIYFHVVTVDTSEEISTYISTDNGLSYGTGNFHNEFYLERSGDSWPEVYDVFIRRGEKKYPGMYLNFDRGENSPIEKIQYSLDDGALTDLTEEFLSYDIYRYNAKVKFVLTPKSGVDNLEVGIDWDQNYIGTTAPFTGFVFANNEIVITKPADAEEWGALYEIGINVPGQTQPAETFNIEFPDSMNVIRNLEFTTDDVNSGNVTWRPATRDENGGRYYIEAEKNWTAITIKMTPCDHITDGLDVRFESLAQNGAEPAAMSGIAVNNNQFTLVKPYEGENPDWAYGYIVTVTAKNDNPTPTPDPQNELAKFGGYRIRLDGYVGISYYVALDQGIRDSNTKITFTFDSINPEFSRQEIGFDSARYVAEPGAGDFYVFDFKVAPNDMTKTITATLTNGEYSLTFEQFTARDYVDYYSKHGTGNLAALANSIKNYGYYTQLKFGPSDPIFAGDAMTLTDPSYERVTVGSIQDGISYSGSSVVFLSGNKIKHYFTITSNPDAYTFKVNGKTVNKVPEGGNLYSVSTEEIPASVLATGISVEVLYNGTVIKSFSYSAMNYAKAVVDTQGTTSEMKNLVKAFAMYYTAVNAYNNSGN
jgi:hypothetical protein